MFSKKQKIISDYRINVTTTYSHTFFQVNNRWDEAKIFACGRNDYGQLGLGHTKGVRGWTEVSIPKDFQFEKIKLVENHNFMIGKGSKGEVKVFSCGDNWYGQLGLGHKKNVKGWIEVTIPKDFQLEKIAIGFRHTFMIGKGAEGKMKIYSCGYNKNGQLGLGHRQKVKKWTEVPIDKLLEGFKENNDGFSEINDQSKKSSKRKIFEGFRAEDYGL